MNGTLLQDLLGRLSLGQARTLSELASALDVDEALLEQMLSDLERVGYVQMHKTTCEDSCQACDSCAHCDPMHHGRIWAVTEKGLRAARM